MQDSGNSWIRLWEVVDLYQMLKWLEIWRVGPICYVESEKCFWLQISVDININAIETSSQEVFLQKTRTGPVTIFFVLKSEKIL